MHTHTHSCWTNKWSESDVLAGGGIHGRRRFLATRKLQIRQWWKKDVDGTHFSSHYHDRFYQIYAHSGTRVLTEATVHTEGLNTSHHTARYVCTPGKRCTGIPLIYTSPHGWPCCQIRCCRKNSTISVVIVAAVVGRRKKKPVADTRWTTSEVVLVVGVQSTSSPRRRPGRMVQYNGCTYE